MEVSMNKIALWKNVRVYDWTAEKAIIAGNVISGIVILKFVHFINSLCGKLRTTSQEGLLSTSSLLNNAPVGAARCKWESLSSRHVLTTASIEFY